MDEKQQELMFKFQMFEQHAQQLQQQIQAVEQGVVELQSLSLGLDDLIGKTDKEIMAPIGKGIFAKAKLISEDLVVDVGDKNLVKKSIPDTKKIIDDQVEKLGEIKKELEENMEKMGEELNKLLGEAQKAEASKEKEDSEEKKD